MVLLSLEAQEVHGARIAFKGGWVPRPSSQNVLYRSSPPPSLLLFGSLWLCNSTAIPGYVVLAALKIRNNRAFSGILGMWWGSGSAAAFLGNGADRVAVPCLSFPT